MHTQQYFYGCVVVYGMENVRNEFSVDATSYRFFDSPLWLCLQPSHSPIRHPSLLLSLQQTLVDCLTSDKLTDKLEIFEWG